MEKFFNVAGHVFSAIADDNSPIWGRIDNYSPFLVDGAVSLFSVTVCDSVDTEGAEVVYIDDKGDTNMSRIDIYRIGDDWLFRLAPVKNRPICAELRLSADYSHGYLAMLRNDIQSVMFAFNNAMMLCYAFSTSSESTLEMHSSVVVKEGRGYMFLGKSGTGKSTHSSLWLKHLPGCYLLNDDNPIIRIIDGIPTVFGSPWSGKTPCYKQDNVPIGAIVSLEQFGENSIERLFSIRAYADIYSSCSGFRAEKSIADGLHDTMEKIVETVPCYHLKCLPDKDAAVLCCQSVSKC